MVMPDSSFRRSIAGRISALRAASSAARGSSINSTRGLTASARAIATRCRSPPDRPAVPRASSDSMPVQATASSIEMRRCAGASRFQPNSTLARTSRCSNRLASWKTTPTARRCVGTNTPAASSCQTSPSTTTRPPGARSRPARQRSSVVLPQPDGPNSALTPRAGSVSATSSMKAPRGRRRVASIMRAARRSAPPGFAADRPTAAPRS